MNKECGRGVFSCLERFRCDPGLVRNWRFLWSSMPKHHRRTHLMEAARGQGGFTFLGVSVCVEAFKILTGVSAGTLQQARSDAAKNKVTVLSRSEMGLWQSVRNTPRAHKYLDTCTR